MIRTPFQLVKKNLIRYPRRSLLMISSFMIASFILFSSVFMFQSVANGSVLLEDRVGADLIISQGEINPYQINSKSTEYFSGKEFISYLNDIEEVEKVAPQLYLETVSTICCGTEGDFPVVAIDPQHDFTLAAFQLLQEPIQDDEVVIGIHAGGDNFLPHAGDRAIKERILLFYDTYVVKDSLFETGSSMDETIYMSLNRAQKVITDPIYAKNLPEDPLSAVFIQVKQGSVDSIVKLINQGFPNLTVQQGSEMKETVRQFIQPMKLLTISVVLLVLLMNVIQVMTLFIAIVQERKKEIGMLRVMGASKWQVAKVIVIEAFIIGTIGGMLGVGLSMALLYDQKDLLLISIELPLILPDLLDGIYYGMGITLFSGAWGSLGAVLIIRSLLETSPYYLIQEGEIT